MKKWQREAKTTNTLSPEEHEDEDGEEQGDDGDGVSEQEDELILPVVGAGEHGGVVQALRVVGEVLPGPVLQTSLRDVVCKQHTLGEVDRGSQLSNSK